MGIHTNQELLIEFQDINLIATDDSGNVLAVVPDLICIVDSDTGEPITTEVLRYGQRAAILCIPVPE